MPRRSATTWASTPTPMQRFGTLNDEMLRAMRLVVDTGIHAKGWTRDQAIALHARPFGHGRRPTPPPRSSATSRSRARRSAYKIGALTIQQLRERGEGGARAEVRHPRIPRAGARYRARCRCTILEQKIDRWIAAKQGGTAPAPASAPARPPSERGYGFDPLQRLGDQSPAVVDAVERDEAAHARALARSRAGSRRAPGTSRAGFRTGGACRPRRPASGCPRRSASAGSFASSASRSRSAAASISLGRAALQRRRDEIAGIIDREADQLVELGVALGRGVRAHSAGRISTRCPCRRRRAG